MRALITFALILIPVFTFTASPAYSASFYGQYILPGNYVYEIWLGQTDSGDVMIIYSNGTLLAYAGLSIVTFTASGYTNYIATGLMYGIGTSQYTACANAKITLVHIYTMTGFTPRWTLTLEPLSSGSTDSEDSIFPISNYPSYSTTNVDTDLVDCLIANNGSRSACSESSTTCGVDINSITVSGTKQAGNAVSFTVDASDRCGQTVYYKYTYHSGYGTNSYTGTNWTNITSSFTTSNAISCTFQQAGQYVVVVWATTDPDNVNASTVQTIGVTVDILE